MKHVVSIFIGILTATFFGVLIAHAADGSYVPLAPLPLGDGGSTPGAYTINSYLSGMLKLIIALGGGLSILMAIVGGTQYVASGAIPDAKSHALERVQNALTGLALILASYLILNSINPQLVQFNFMLPPVGVAPEQMVTPGVGQAGQGLLARTGTCPTPNDSSSACCPAGISCQACSNCSIVANVPNKGCGIGTCFLETSLLSKIQGISGINGWRITESWPPTVDHISNCHQNGTCADLNNSGGATDPTTIKRYYDAFQAAGLNVLYESMDCAPYVAAGISNCKTYSTMTNRSSFHVR